MSFHFYTSEEIKKQIITPTNTLKTHYAHPPNTYKKIETTHWLNYILYQCKVTTIFGINGILTKEFYSCFFQVLYFRFVTLRVRGQKYGSFGCKLHGYR